MQINYYEKAGIIFSHEENAFMSLNLFLDALFIEPDNSMIWYECGDSLLSVAIKAQNASLIDKAIFCIQKSTELDSTNMHSKNMMETLKKDPALLNKINSIKQYTLDDLKSLRADIISDHLITFFKSFNNRENQISLIMFLGETRDNKYFELLKHCILNEEDQHVRFSALKRIHHFQEKNNLEAIFKKIIDDKSRKDYEPYFSMSLSQINTNWSHELLKESEVDLELVDQTLNYASVEKEETNNEDEAKAIIYLSLSKYDLNELKNFYEFKNEKVLIEGITRNLSKLGFYKLFELNILNKTDSKLTNYGWQLIEDFLNKQIEIKKKEIENQANKPKLKWWQF